MNFDLDDPLGDLLSDGSNDSFFEKNTKKAVETKNKDVGSSSKQAPATSKMENLFGITTEDVKPPPKTQQVYQSSTLSGHESSIKKNGPLQKSIKGFSSPAKTTKSINLKKEITFEEDDDTSLDLGFDPKKPKSASKKSSILSDLLGVSEPRKTATTVNKPKTPPTRVPNSANLSRQNISEKSESVVNEAIGGPTYAASPVGRSRTLSKHESSTSLNDPLGLFSSNTASETKIVDNQSTKQIIPTTTTDWLGIGDDSQSKKSEPLKNLQISALVPNFSKKQPYDQHQLELQGIPLSTAVDSSSHPIRNIAETLKPNISETAQILTTTTKETETALTALKHQESQLVIAAQMKNQEVALMEMQKRQQEMLHKQETNFNELLQKQLHRQSALEIDIKRQQERINSHIQILMSQPMSEIKNGKNDDERPTISNEKQPTAKTEIDEYRMNEIVLRSDIKILELEKLRLENLVHNIETNHDLELNLMEQSQKKQISLMEENISKLEQRLRNENQSLQEFYEKKLSIVDKDNQELINSYEIKLKSVEERYEILIESIKNDHRNMIQNIRESKLLEFSLVQENTSYLQTLKNASNYMETASENMQTVRDELHDRIETIYEERNMQLTIREKSLQVQQKQMEKYKEATENERTRLLDLIKSLEIKLNTLTQTCSEEQWNLRQTQVSLDAERTSLERERSFLREQQVRDEKRIENLRHDQINEHKRLMKQVDDERTALLADRSKNEMMSRLNRPIDVSIPSRTEIDSAIKIAEDAASQCDAERERYIELQRIVEIKKREIVDKERSLRAKESELESSISVAESKQKNAEVAIKSTKMVETQLIEKITMLQQNYRDLTNREQNLSQAKLEMTKERLELQSIRNKLYQSRCSLCKIGERSQELADILTKNTKDNEFLTTLNNSNEIAEIKNDYKSFDMPNLDMDSKQYEKYLDLEVTTALNKIKEDSTHNLEINLDSIPDLTNTSNNLLDHELLLVKLDAMREYNYL